MVGLFKSCVNNLNREREIELPPTAPVWELSMFEHYSQIRDASLQACNKVGQKFLIVRCELGVQYFGLQRPPSNRVEGLWNINSRN